MPSVILSSAVAAVGGPAEMSVSELLQAGMTREIAQKNKMPLQVSVRDGQPLCEPDGSPNLGILEMVAFSELNILAIKAKVDTGACISVLGVSRYWYLRHKSVVGVVLEYELQGRKCRVKFEWPIKRIAKIREANSRLVRRPVIETVCCLGGFQWPMELALARRSNRKHPVLIGRKAIKGLGAKVDCGRMFIHQTPSWDEFMAQTRGG